MVTLREKAKNVKHIYQDLGASCIGYIRLTPKYSLKLFKEKSDRDGSFVRQRIAHKLKFAPKVLFKINKGRAFGYITEHAETDVELTDKQFRFLKTKLRSQKWSVCDITHYDNIGIINNKPVVIDFDSFSLGLKEI